MRTDIRMIIQSDQIIPIKNKDSIFFKLEMQQFYNQLATNLQPTCNQLATHLQPTCNRLATNLQPTCNRLATDLQPTCNRLVKIIQSYSSRLPKFKFFQIFFKKFKNNIINVAIDIFDFKYEFFHFFGVLESYQTKDKT